MGNRGCLLDGKGQMCRSHQGKRWIACLLEFKGQRLELMKPGHNTQLFVLDEATALAAGHRPCMACRRSDYLRFRDHWTVANSSLAGGPKPSVETIDAVLHQERIARDGNRVLYPERLANLPTGTFIVIKPGGSTAYLVYEHRLLLWASHGYALSISCPQDRFVQVLTPQSIVRAIADGYQPGLHPSAHSALLLTDGSVGQWHPE